MHRRNLLSALAAGVATPAAAQARPIRCIVPFTAGGATDVTTRLICEKASAHLGTIIIENRPGGGGGIGVDLVAKAAPDGHTIGMAALAMHAINPWLYRKLPYDPIRDFEPLTQMVRIPNVLVMNADTARRLRIATVGDFIAYARANPGRLSYASGGNGSGGHLAGEMFKQQAGFFAVHIPYNGGGPSQLAMLSGIVDYTLDNLATSGANIRAGKVLPLAVTTLRRSPLLPEVPAMAERFPGFEVDTWWGLVAPGGTPSEVVGRLNATFVAALQSPDVRERFAAMMAEPVPTTPEQFAQLIRREHRRYEHIVKASGAQVD